MPKYVGYCGDKIHETIVNTIRDQEAFYLKQMEPNIRKQVQYWNLFMAHKPDDRKPWEKWRAKTFTPWPFGSTQAKIAALGEIFGSIDPMVQVEGIGYDNNAGARKFEAMFEWAFRINRWPLLQDSLFRSAIIQGQSDFIKPVWVEKISNIPRPAPSIEDVRRFEQAVEMATLRGAPDPPSPDDYEQPEFVQALQQWCNNVNKAKKFGVVPEPPFPGTFEYVEFRGPALKEVSLWDTRFDPRIKDWNEQHLFIHRMVKTREWVRARAGNGPKYPYDPRQVEYALNKKQGPRFQTWENEIASRFNLGTPVEDPYYQDACEIWECWLPNSRTPRVVILNREAIINKDPTVHPFLHKRLPFISLRNIPIKNFAMGMSDYQLTERLIHETNTLRDLRIDAVTLAVIPLFMKLKNMGLPELQRFLRPGAIIDVDNAQGLQTITKWNAGIQDVFSEIDSLKNDIDEALGTQPSVRGSTATVGRVSATEHQARLTQSLGRIKQTASCYEQDLNEIPVQIAFLMYQKAPDNLRFAIGGSDTPGDPFVSMNRSDFMELLSLNYGFRGATRSLNRELSGQQLQGWLTEAVNSGGLVPTEIRATLKRVLEIWGHKGIDGLITEEGTQQKQVEAQMQQLAVQGQQMAMQQQAQTTGVSKQEVPEEVEL